MRLAPTKPWEFTSSEGYLIRVGRNNRQNDMLTLKESQKGDLWLHVQKLHGSHVVIACGGKTPGTRPSPRPPCWLPGTPRRGRGRTWPWT